MTQQLAANDRLATKTDIDRVERLIRNLQCDQRVLDFVAKEQRPFARPQANATHAATTADLERLAAGLNNRTDRIEYLIRSQVTREPEPQPLAIPLEVVALLLEQNRLLKAILRRQQATKAARFIPAWFHEEEDDLWSYYETISSLVPQVSYRGRKLA